jgi:hypothetical protein
LTKTCPRCRLPITAIGRAIAATSSDGERSGVIGICRRCTAEEAKLPAGLLTKRLQPAADRALNDPGRYYCTIYDRGAAILATALLGHPDYATRTLVALGWIPDDCPTFAEISETSPARVFRGRTIG